MTATFPRFAVRTEVLTGLGSLARLDALVAGFGHREVAVVADTALEQAGVLDRVLDHAPETLIVSRTLVDPDPDVEVVEKAAAQVRAAGARCVLAVGGGSALGVGKAVGIRLTNDQRIDAYEGCDKVGEQPAPTIAVPTTAGSGSEVSNALVLHEAGRDNEIVVRGELCAPAAAVLDATVLRSLPRNPLVYSALDALSHALEALWAGGASYFTSAVAIPAARSIIARLPAAAVGADDGGNAAGANDDALQELLEASCAANMACGNSGLALIHALSSSPSVRVPHGLQNAVLLPHVARFNAPLLGAETLTLLPLIELLYDELDLAPSFAAIGHGPVDGPRMLEASARNPFRANNLRATTDADLVALLRAAGATFPRGAAMTADDTDLRVQLAHANHILFDQGVLDAFGHVSVRTAARPDRFFLARNMAPVLVTPADVQEYDLDGTTVDPAPSYLERFIHAEIYRARPDVHAVVHSHSASVIPFGLSPTPLRAVFHMAGFLVDGVARFEIRDAAGDATDLLVRDARLGAALASALGDAPFALMRGHGSVAVGPSLPLAVYRAVYAEENAALQLRSLPLADVDHLTAGEGRAAAETNAGQVGRAWDMWLRLAGRHQSLRTD